MLTCNIGVIVKTFVLVSLLPYPKKSLDWSRKVVVVLSGMVGRIGMLVSINAPPVAVAEAEVVTVYLTVTPLIDEITPAT